MISVQRLKGKGREEKRCSTSTVDTESIFNLSTDSPAPSRTCIRLYNSIEKKMYHLVKPEKAPERLKRYSATVISVTINMNSAKCDMAIWTQLSPKA